MRFNGSYSWLVTTLQEHSANSGINDTALGGKKREAFLKCCVNQSLPCESCPVKVDAKIPNHKLRIEGSNRKTFPDVLAKCQVSLAKNAALCDRFPGVPPSLSVGEHQIVRELILCE